MTLLDLTRELFTYLVVFRQRAVSAAPPSLETVNEELEGLFLALEERAREHPLLSGPYQQVRYNLTVLSDEVLLTSAWPQAVDWALEPLEQRLYGSRQGGTRFFQLLEEQEGAPRDVLALYYLCLGLGFCGCYTPDDPSLVAIKAGLLERLRAPLKPPPPEPTPPPPRRPAFREQAPAPEPSPPEPAPPEPAPPEPSPPEPSPASLLEPEPQPVPMAAPGPPPEAPAAAPEPKPAPPAQEAPAPPRTLARPPGRPAPAPRRARAGWRVSALALGASGLAGVFLWLTLGLWQDGAPPGKIDLNEKVLASLPAAEIAKVPEPHPPLPVMETAQAPEPASLPAAAQTAKAPPPPSTVETAQAPEPAVPPPPVETAQAPEPAPLPPAPQAEPGVYILHAGLYVGPIQSGRLAQRLKEAGLPAFVRQEVRGEGKVRYLVLVGPYKQEAQAQEAMEQIQRRFGVRPFFLEPPQTRVPLR